MTSLQDKPPQGTDTMPPIDEAAVPVDVADLIAIDAAISSRLVERAARRLPEELTSTQAVERFGMSRPTLKKKISKGMIPAHKVGTHTRLSTRDVLEHLRRSHLDHLLDFVSLALKDASDGAEPHDGAEARGGAEGIDAIDGVTPS